MKSITITDNTQHNYTAIKLLILIVLMAGLGFLSLILGYQMVRVDEVVGYFSGDIVDNVVLTSVRLPRTIAAITVGIGLGIAGTLMQVLTKNPIASPSLFGIHSGAAFCMVIATIFFPYLSLNDMLYFVILGAFLAGVLVFLIAGVFTKEVSAIKLTLCGVSVAILFSSVTQAILAQNQSSFEEVFFFLAGSLNFRDLNAIITIMPLIFLTALIPIILHRPIGILAIGDNIAKALGQNVRWIKITLFFLSITLAALCVSISGPIALIGLISPHIAKKLIGVNYWGIISASGLIGANLLIASDILARFLIYPKELPVGALSLILGSLFFIYLAKKQ